jgi:hypothetical protein
MEYNVTWQFYSQIHVYSKGAKIGARKPVYECSQQHDSYEAKFDSSNVYQLMKRLKNVAYSYNEIPYFFLNHNIVLESSPPSILTFHFPESGLSSF